MTRTPEDDDVDLLIGRERERTALASVLATTASGSGGVVLVEWGERLPPYLRRDAMVVRLHDVGEGSRRIEIATQPKAGGRPRGDA